MPEEMGGKEYMSLIPKYARKGLSKISPYPNATLKEYLIFYPCITAQVEA